MSPEELCELANALDWPSMRDQLWQLGCDPDEAISYLCQQANAESINSSLIQRLRECLPTAADGPDHRTYCTVLGEDLRAAVEELSRQAEAVPVAFEYRWTNPGDYEDQPDSMLEWKRVEPSITRTVAETIADLKGYRHDGKPCYEVRALYTHPAPEAQATRLRAAQMIEELTNETNNQAAEIERLKVAYEQLKIESLAANLMGNVTPTVNMADCETYCNTAIRLTAERDALRKDAERMRTALEWYADEAKACARNSSKSDHASTQALLASVTVLSLDNGRRAADAICTTTPREPSS